MTVLRCSGQAGVSITVNRRVAGRLDDRKYIYLEEANSTETQIAEGEPAFTPIPIHRHLGEEHERVDPNTGLTQKRGAEWEPHLKLPPPLYHLTSGELSEPCDTDNPELCHVFWAGSFTDKPYLALLSLLFTQNTGIHLQDWPANPRVCRPQFWLWINPGPAAAVSNPNALGNMYDSLKANPWAAPFLHSRFKDVSIQGVEYDGSAAPSTSKKASSDDSISFRRLMTDFRLSCLLWRRPLSSEWRDLPGC
ncbi:hypothetical protein PM082_009093 [Marasmius tenuissimus]|nr:hypothetical protein PM082_009093 [Marasmius tenuissimus]